MEKRKKYLLFIIMLAFFLFIGNVRAADDLNDVCKPTELSSLRSMAANVKVTYVPVKFEEKLDTPNFETGNTVRINNYLDIKIYNLNTKLEVTITAPGVNEIRRVDSAGVDGAITLRQVPLNETVTYKFEVRALNGCHSHVLRTLSLTLPRYNFYSQLSACNDIPDYYLCQEYTTYKVDGATFYDRVDEYKAKLLTLEEKENSIDNGIVSKTISGISKYKYVIVGVVVAIGVLLTIFILNRKKSVL